MDLPSLWPSRLRVRCRGRNPVSVSSCSSRPRIGDELKGLPLLCFKELRQLASFDARLDEADHLVHELEQFGGARGGRQGLSLIALVELPQTGDG